MHESTNRTNAELAAESSLRDLQALLARGKLKEALQGAQDLTSRHATDPRTWRLLCSFHSRAGHWQEAIDCAKRAVALARADPDSLLLYAQCLAASGARRAALNVVEQLVFTRLDRADWNDALGTLLTYCEDPTRALKFFERAVALAPASSVFRYNLATAQRMTGALAAAETNLDQVISATPGDARAFYTRSDLRTQTAESNHINEMVSWLSQSAKDPRDEIMMCFALAKELDDVSRYEESFGYLKRGCDRQRSLTTYDVNDDVATIDRIIQVHTTTALRERGGLESQASIFVFGLPRSGTTMLERILASHSQVHAAGELQAFPTETIKAVQRNAGRAIGKLEFVERALDTDPRALGQAYLAAAHPQAAEKVRWVDKQPLNYLYAGMIARALPRARIIALARDPIDSCFAMYKTLFAGAYPFSYDLSDLGQYYAAWHRLMRHWQAVLGERLLIVHYEDLVDDQEPVTREILAHCGLDWENACLAFQEQRSAVTTASAVQVRQGMYSSSIGKWRRFERQLAPLTEFLERHKPIGGWRFTPKVRGKLEE